MQVSGSAAAKLPVKPRAAPNAAVPPVKAVKSGMALLNDTRITMPSFKLGASTLNPAGKVVPVQAAPAAPAVASKMRTETAARDAAATAARVGAVKNPGSIGAVAKTVVNKVAPVAQGVQNAAKSVAQGVQNRSNAAADATTAHNEAAAAGGVHPILSNIVGGGDPKSRFRGSAMGYGALAGAALGAVSPGRDEDGNENSSVGGALRGAAKGGLIGGLGGMAIRQEYVDPMAAPHLQKATDAVAARRAGTAPVLPAPVLPATQPVTETAAGGNVTTPTSAPFVPNVSTKPFEPYSPQMPPQMGQNPDPRRFPAGSLNQPVKRSGFTFKISMPNLSSPAPAGAKPASPVKPTLIKVPKTSSFVFPRL